MLQLKTLQSNFNPHFIYNCMSLIQSLIIGNQQKKAVEVTAKLAKLNRTFLENSDNELISLHDEINFIKDYVEMERLRFESDTEFQFQIHTTNNFQIKSWRIPPLILQPLIENSIKHGVMADEQCTNIDLYLHSANQNCLEIRIENKYPKQRKKGNKGIGIGLKLVADRLSLLSELHPELFRTSFDYGIENESTFAVRIVIERMLSLDETYSKIEQDQKGIKKEIEMTKWEGGGVKYNIPIT